MDYFEDTKTPQTRSALCSDPACPCSDASIPVNGGYLWVSRDLVEFRRDCRTVEQRDKKLDRIARQSGHFIMFGHGVASPILMCQVGARKRGLNLEVAAADARHWWSTGKVPYRMTPMEGQSGSDPQLSVRPSESQPGGCGVALLLMPAAYAAYHFLHTSSIF